MSTKGLWAVEYDRGDGVMWRWRTRAYSAEHAWLRWQDSNDGGYVALRLGVCETPDGAPIPEHRVKWVLAPQ